MKTSMLGECVCVLEDSSRATAHTVVYGIYDGMHASRPSSAANIIYKKKTHTHSKSFFSPSIMFNSSKRRRVPIMVCSSSGLIGLFGGLLSPVVVKSKHGRLLLVARETKRLRAAINVRRRVSV